MNVSASRRPDAIMPRRMILPTPLQERSLSSRLQGKTVCIALDNEDFDRLRVVVNDVLSQCLSCGTFRITGWSGLLRNLPSMSEDLLIIMSPRSLAADFESFEKGLFCFKTRNPHSAVVMSNLHSPAAEASQRLASLSGIDHIEQGFTFFPVLLHIGAERLDEKV